MNHQAIIQLRYPTARVIEDYNPRTYHRFRVIRDDGPWGHLGGGPTEDEAWRNVWVHHGQESLNRTAR